MVVYNGSIIIRDWLPFSSVQWNSLRLGARNTLCSRVSEMLSCCQIYGVIDTY